jgi:anti-sigma B factor antagonist
MVPDEAELELTVDEGAEPVVVTVAGEVDITVADRFRECLLTEADLGRRLIVVDMSRLRFMDSSGLSALIAGRRALGSDGTIVLREPTEMVRKLLEVTGATALFEVA